MSSNETKIEWTRFTVNPWEGCMKVGPGCDFCYAENGNKRWKGGRHWGPKGPRLFVKGWADKLAIAKRVAKKEGRRVTVFTASVSDIFELDKPLEGLTQTIDDVRREFFSAVEQSPECTFLLLTKRPQNISKLVPAAWLAKCPENVWFGCSIVDQAEANRDIPHLAKSPGAGNKFLSIEPMLGPIDLSVAMVPCPNCDGTGQGTIDEGGGHACPKCLNFPQGRVSVVSWVITGGESGVKGKVRAIQPDWISEVRDFCKQARIPFFFKQWGNHTPMLYYSHGGAKITMAYNKNQHHNDFPFGSGKLHQDYPQSMTAPL